MSKDTARMEHHLAPLRRKVQRIWLSWHRNPSVTEGGNLWFWTTRTEYGMGRVVWDRRLNRWRAELCDVLLSTHRNPKQARLAVRGTVALMPKTAGKNEVLRWLDPAPSPPRDNVSSSMTTR